MVERQPWPIDGESERGEKKEGDGEMVKRWTGRRVKGEESVRQREGGKRESTEIHKDSLTVC